MPSRQEKQFAVVRPEQFHIPLIQSLINGSNSKEFDYTHNLWGTFGENAFESKKRIKNQQCKNNKKRIGKD